MLPWFLQEIILLCNLLVIFQLGRLCKAKENISESDILMKQKVPVEGASQLTLGSKKTKKKETHKHNKEDS